MTSMRINSRRTSQQRQRGALTLAVSLAILMLSTLVTFNVSKAILMEQKITNNDTRAKMAFEAAEAGIIAALDYIENDPNRVAGANTYGAANTPCGLPAGSLMDCVVDTNADGLGDTNIASVGSATVTVTLTDLSTNLTNIRIVATGQSDDRTATRQITQTIMTINPLPNAPDNPVITRGSMIIGGSATVHNQEGHSTIWTGSEIDMGSNNSTATEVPDVGDTPSYPTCMDTPGLCTLVQASDNSVKGLDVIENDTSLSALSDVEFFENFFGINPTTYRSSMVTLETDTANANTDVDLAAHEVVWVEGDAAFTGVTVGCTTSVTGSNVCAAANTKPSIVIVNGNASFSGGSQFYGILFVMGNVNISGNTTIRGALVTAGDAESSTGGSFDVWYNSSILGGTSLAGATTGSAGTWKDF